VSDSSVSEPLRSTEERPTEEVLTLLSFKRTPGGTYERAWPPVQVIAGRWVVGWMVLIDYFSQWSRDKRVLRGPREYHCSWKTSPAEFLALLYHWCHDAFEDTRFEGSGALPRELQIGREHWREKMFPPPSSTVWVDREFFRFCLSYLEKRQDWFKEDYTIKFQFAEAQLRLESHAQPIFCPARGTLFDIAEVSAAGLFRALPKRFTRPVVSLTRKGERLLLDYHPVPAKWTEVAQMKVI
jgi:hypothetical protein